MKKKLLTGLAFGVMMIGMAGMADAITINFDTLPGGSSLSSHSVLTNQYAALGVKFTGFEDGSQVDTFVDDYWGASPAGGNYWSNMLPGNDDLWGTTRRDILRVSFTEATSNIGFDYWNSQGSEYVTFNFYDSANQLIGTQSLTTASWQTVSFSYIGVSYFDMLQPTDSWGYNVDNLRFESTTAAPVPEPSVMLLMGIGGIGGLVEAARRRKKAC